MFYLCDQSGTELLQRMNIGLINKWLIRTNYFEEHPDAELTLTRFDYKYDMKITKDTTADEIKKFGDDSDKCF